MQFSEERELVQLEEKRKQLLTKLEQKRANQMFYCVCGGTHKIKTCHAIQTHWYTPPSGCTEGDYWNEGELMIRCPVSELVNRVLFDNYDVEWSLRNHYSHNPDQQFRRIYKSLFKTIEDDYKKGRFNWKNNDYFDNNRKKFGLVEKKENKL